MSATDGADAHSEWKPKANRWAIVVVVTLAAFMEILDTTIVNVSLPHIAGSLSASYDESTWALTSYLLANGVVLMISGWLSSLLGRKRYFIICVAMFTVCSFLCGSATSLAQLVFFRLLQGFFGGGMQPCQQSIILDTFPPEKRAAAFGVTAIATIVAPVLGPTLGGYITDTYSWRWVFFINVPVGVGAIFLISALIQDPPWLKRSSLADIDYAGLALIMLGLGALQVTLDRGQDDDWFASPFIKLMAALAVVGIIGAVVWLLRARKPVVDLSVLRDRNFATSCALIGATGGILYAGAVVIPQFTQTIIGYDATWSGLVLSPGALMIILMIPVIGRIMPLVQTRALILIGFLTMGASFFYSTRLTTQMDFSSLVFLRATQTAGLAFLFVPISTIAFAQVPRELNGDATALFVMLRNVCGSIGISVASALILRRSQTHQAYLSQWATPLHEPFNALVETYRRALSALGYVGQAAHDAALGKVYQVYQEQSATLAYADVFLVAGLVSFAVAPLCFLLSSRKGGGGAAAH
ncbi:DHA2 family efflux MFS transporter permease subunit [Methylosinus sp. LW4]|uniref:DHA2 family efflux MFS transporter permease subunit n=1 Tax=Methylosinus sp. LW4 TaxID=136993 RepID=UPI000378A11E|nr:DHA2 family efflux MFS transporter permease subunit [Methylosinus sp. LW4]